jgi:tetratricopeptide (TPR) repeat protein
MRTIAAILAVSLACGVARAMPPGLEAAAKATQDGKWREATSLWQTASNRYPGDADVTAELGFAEVNAGRVPDAKRDLNRALRLAPLNLRAQTSMVAVAIAERRFDDAVVAATKAVRTHPDSPDAYRCLGDAQKSASHRSEAEDAYRHAVALGPDDWRNHATLGDAILMRNKADEAIKEYRQAVRLNPEDEPLREALGRASMAGSQYAAAARSYIDAMDIVRKSDIAWDKMDTLALSVIDALSRAAAALRDGNESRETVFDANTRAEAVTDALLDLPAIAQSESDAAMTQRAAAYGLIGQAAASDLAALRKTTGSEAADAAVFREQARRAIVAARAASAKPTVQ